MERTRWLERLAYIVLIALAGVFWITANDIDFAKRPGTLGPDFWPKLALALIVIVSLYEIGISFLERSVLAHVPRCIGAPCPRKLCLLTAPPCTIGSSLR